MTVGALFGSDGKLLRLAERIGRGGEGEIYAIQGKPQLALKLYTVRDIASREAKVRCMVGEALSSRASLIAFPIEMVFDQAGKFAGFTMPLVSGHKPLHELYSPGARKAFFPKADFRFLVLTAANISRAIAMTHTNGAIVGDINHSGILISPNATVTLIDADSFQVSSGQRHFYCTVGVPEYTPPELQGAQLSGVLRTETHDAFGLAVVIFQLLFMGRHPFSGSYSGGSDMPLERSIREFRFAYSNKRSVGMVPPPGVPTLRDFPGEIGAAFEAAFSAEGRNGRPTAKQWIDLLDNLGRSLKVCAISPLHRYPIAAPECPWCRMERRFGIPLFIPALAAFDGNTSFEQTSGDVAAIWRAIEAAQPPAHVPFPQYVSNNPSEAIGKQTQKRRLRRVLGWLFIVAAIGVFAYGQGTPLIPILLVGVGWWVLAQKNASERDLINSYKAVQGRSLKAEADWPAETSEQAFVSLKAELKSKKERYEALAPEERRRVAQYGETRRATQLNAYLDKFLIRRSKIPKIGPAKQATLLSYGIESAADVNEAAILRVPGFGPVNSQPILKWRRLIESRFTFSPAFNDTDKIALNTIRAEIAQKATQLKAELSQGPAKLLHLTTALQTRYAQALPFAQELAKARAQIVADMNCLGLSLPTVEKPVQRLNAPTTSAPNSVSSGASANSGVRCPKCGGGMIIRLAQRGRHRGNKFYGCARYPQCDGIRSFP